MRTLFQFVNRTILFVVVINLANSASADESANQKTPRFLPTSLAASGLSGVAKPLAHAELHPAVSGRIAKVHVVEGQQVAAGQLLVSLEDRVARAAVKVAQVEAAKKGALVAAQIDFNLADRQLKRANLAFQRGAGSQFEIDEKTAVRDQAKAALDQRLEDQSKAAAELAAAQAELERYAIRAPFAGEITRVNSLAGNAADPTQPIISIVDRETLKVELHLPLSDFGRYRAGDQLRLAAGMPVRAELTATVKYASTIVNSASQTFRCVFHIDNQNLKLPAGFVVHRPTTVPVKLTGRKRTQN